jgi:photosystem II stability/assembly factor-like uncharacterized protein
MAKPGKSARPRLPLRESLRADRSKLIGFAVMSGFLTLVSVAIAALDSPMDTNDHPLALAVQRLDPFGRSPKLVEMQADLNAVIVRGGRVWVGGNSGFLAYSDDRGRSWNKGTLLPGNGPSRFGPLTALDVRRAAAAASPAPIDDIVSFYEIGGALEAATRGGNRWQTLDERWVSMEPSWRVMAGVPPRIRAVAHTPQRNVWSIVVNDGPVYELRPGGEIGKLLGARTATPSGALTWYAGSRGMLFPNVSAVPVNAGTTERLNGIFMPQTPMGWAVGDKGTITRSHGENEWTAVKVPTTVDLNAITFSGNLGYIVGDAGVVLRTTNGGDSWKAVTTQSDFRDYPRRAAGPSVLTVFSGGLMLLFLSLAWLGRGGEEAPEPSVADVALTDRPLRTGDADALGLTRIALGISGFLRNENTKPPLTIAITGPWGSGKSSLMNLLRDDLASYGVRSVWFNAWHHQTEDHLLAALLQNIRLQAVPPFFSLAGMSYRARLVAVRVRRHRVQVACLLALFALSLTFVLNDPPPLLEILRGEVRDGAAGVQGILGLIAGIGSAVALIHQCLKSFHISPGALLAGVTRGARLSQLEEQTGFRHRFAQEFAEVAAALNPKRTMMIFIDDLDRCRPEKIVDVLEAVNFLTSSGDCYVVLGLARDRVEPAVGLSFKDVAAEMALTSDAKSEAQARLEYARQYLDKLINIEVAVPPPDSDRARDLFLPETDAAADDGDPLTPLGRWLTLAAAVAMVLAATWAMARAGIWLSDALRPKPEVARATAQAPVVEARVTSVSSKPAASDPSPGTPALNITSQPARLIEPPPPSIWTVHVPIALVVIVLTPVVVWYLRRRPGLALADSDRFRDAVDYWSPAVAPVLGTPRAMKRFMNRLRFLAMRERAFEEQHSVWQELAVRLRLRKPRRRTFPPGTTIREETLVALASANVLEDAGTNVTHMLKRHAARFGDDPESNADAYRHLMRGVAVR